MASQRDRRGMTPYWPRTAFENHSIQCDSRSSGLDANCGASFSASQNSGGVLREAPASGQPCLRIDGMGRVHSGDATWNW